ncbi:MAG: Nif3-like dinuclear metal center hexameric protein [Planctomycetota bacterium]
MTPGIPLTNILSTLGQFAPLRLAEGWDNVGLLVGDRNSEIHRVMTCLTITPDVVEEAVASKADLIVAHHPLPFKPLAKLNTDSAASGMLWQLARAGVAVYSAHTAMDSARQGINQMLAEAMSLDDIGVLDPAGESTGTSASTTVEGSGRFGKAGDVTMTQILHRLGECLGANLFRCVVPPGKDANKPIKRVAVACGSGGSFLPLADRQGCDLMVTGEATFHTCLDAQNRGIGLVLLGHFHSERFAMERLAEFLAHEHDEISVWASRCETDPIVEIAVKDGVNLSDR